MDELILSDEKKEKLSIKRESVLFLLLMLYYPHAIEIYKASDNHHCYAN